MRSGKRYMDFHIEIEEEIIQQVDKFAYRPTELERR